MALSTNKYLLELKDKVNQKLEEYIPPGTPETLWDAMRYSVLGSGKRIRAILCIESCKVFGGTEEIALPTACSIEIIHAQSLIHDDLPCMDNDDYRRGLPATHKKYGAAMAILAGDALIPLSYEVFLQHTPASVPDNTKLKIIHEFSDTIGGTGLVGGQVVDVENEGKKINAETLEYIHSNKTGALFRFSLRSGALLAGCTDIELKLITDFSKSIGLAFQISDDILDVIGTKESLGKTPGKDKASGKNTYPLIHGLEQSRTEVKKLCRLAKNLLTENNINSELFFEINDYIANRVEY